jgi:WD40 repeat protein
MKYRIWALTLLLILPWATAIAAAPATAPAAKPAREQYAVGAKVEAIFGYGAWRKGTVKNVDGDIYLVVFDAPWDKQFYWTWVHINMVRPVGGDKPAPQGQMGVKVGNETIPAAKADAVKAFADFQAAPPPKPETPAPGEAVTPGQPPKTGVAAGGSDIPTPKPAVRDPKVSPFEPIPYDKPVITANVTGIQEKSLASAITRPVIPAPCMPKFMSSHWIVAKSGVAGGTTSVMHFADNFAAVVNSTGSVYEPTSLRVERMNLMTGASDGYLDWELNSRPISLSPSGQRLLSRAMGFFPGMRHRVSLWNLSGAPLAARHLLSFEPYKGNEKGHNDVDVASLLDDTHLLTVSSGGELVLWEIGEKSVKGVWRLAAGSSAKCIVSPSRKQIASYDGKALAVLDAMSGAPLSLFPSEVTLTDLSWSPDGKTIVGFAIGTLSHWDLEKGLFVGAVGIPGSLPASKATALNGGFVLLQNQYLFDLSSRLFVRKYEAVYSDVACHGSRCWQIFNNNPQQTLMSAELPSEPVRQAAKAAAANADEAMLMHPASSVSIEMAINAGQDEVNAARAALTAQLSRNRITVVDGAPIKLVAKTEDGKTIERKWQVQSFGPGGGTRMETASVTEKIVSVQIQSGDATPWSTRSVNAPNVVVPKQGQSFADALAAANQYDLKFFQNVRLPAYVLKDVDIHALPKSKWGGNGINDNVTDNLTNRKRPAMPPKAAK